MTDREQNIEKANYSPEVKVLAELRIATFLARLETTAEKCALNLKDPHKFRDILPEVRHDAYNQ